MHDRRNPANLHRHMFAPMKTVKIFNLHGYKRNGSRTHLARDGQGTERDGKMHSRSLPISAFGFILTTFQAKF